MCWAITTTTRARNGELDRKRFWEARFTRIYPIYFLSLLLSLGNLRSEYASHTHAMFWTGVVLTPLLLQGFDSGRRHVSEYAGVDHVGRSVLLRDFSLAGAAGSARCGWRRT